MNTALTHTQTCILHASKQRLLCCAALPQVPKGLAAAHLWARSVSARGARKARQLTRTQRSNGGNK